MNACTLWFDSLGPFNWHDCCVAHDVAYGAGVNKLLADDTLAVCVNHVLPGMGLIMLLGVSSVIGWAFYLRAWLQRRKAE